MKKNEKDVETIRGDGLYLKMDSNNRLLEIIGDGCKINLVKNCGIVRIIGDGCRLKVTQNLGSIEYKGDGGRVDLGSDFDKNNVTFVGHGSHLNTPVEKISKSHRNKKNIKPENTRKEDIQSNVKEIEKQKEISEFENDNHNNERRERKKKLIANFERGSNVKVTKILCSNGEFKTIRKSTNITYVDKKEGQTRS